MRNISVRLILFLLVLGAVSVAPLTSIAQNSNQSATKERMIVGFISDNHCGLRHMKGMNEKDCTLMCVKNGGKFVVADRDHKRIYQLDKTGQEKARDFAGQKR